MDNVKTKSMTSNVNASLDSKDDDVKLVSSYKSKQKQ